MKNVLPLFTCFLLIKFSAVAQFNTVEKIRAYYNKINGKISSAQKDKIGMYCNEVVVNKLGGSWPGVGNYQKRISIWYSDDPVSAGTDRPADYLEKVNISGESAGEKFTEEYLFWNGELLFYCFFDSYKENDIGQRDEHRLYFSKGKLLKYDLKQGSRGVEVETQKTIQNQALSHGNIMKTLFLNSCEYIKEEVSLK
jgi:hypothetical protein